MKKTYINPQTITVSVRVVRMIAASATINDEEASVDEGGDYDDARQNTYIQPSNVWDDYSSSSAWDR